MQAEYHANVYTLVTVSNDKQNIQHRSTTSSLVQVMHVHLLFSDTYNKNVQQFSDPRWNPREKPSTYISLHKFPSVLSGLIPLNTFKSIIHLQTNTSVFLTTIQGLGNLNWFSFSLKAPQIFFTWSQHFSHLVHCVCPKCYVSYALEPRSGYVPNILYYSF